MKLEAHIEKSLESFERGDKEEALMHACFAIEATARNVYSVLRASKRDYKNCLRKYYWTLEAFGCPGINLEDTKWTHLELTDDRGKKQINPDLSDIIYHIFRCSHAHAQEVPVEYELLPRQGHHVYMRIDLVNGQLQLPESIIFALLAVSVFANANAKIKTNGSHYLTWTDSNLTKHSFPIREWWGREEELRRIIDTNPPIRVKIAPL